MVFATNLSNKTNNYFLGLIFEKDISDILQLGRPRFEKFCTKYPQIPDPEFGEGDLMPEILYKNLSFQVTGAAIEVHKIAPLPASNKKESFIIKHDSPHSSTSWLS